MTVYPRSKVGTKKYPHTDYRYLNFQKLTPMYQHYVDVKDKYPNAL